MYTDGLVERRGEDIVEGIAALPSTCSHGAPSALNDLCDHLVSSLTVEPRLDDVCVLAVAGHHPLEPDRPQPGRARSAAGMFADDLRAGMFADLDTGSRPRMAADVGLPMPDMTGPLAGEPRERRRDLPVTRRIDPGLCGGS